MKYKETKIILNLKFAIDLKIKNFIKRMGFFAFSVNLI
jgi:hypothetical protein